MDDDFVRPGPTQILSRQSLDALGIILNRIDVHFELTGKSLLFGDLGLEGQQTFSVILVLLDQGQVPEENPGHAGEEKEEDGDLGEFIPNPQIHVHWRHLSKRASEREEKKAK